MESDGLMFVRAGGNVLVLQFFIPLLPTFLHFLGWSLFQTHFRRLDSTQFYPDVFGSQVGQADLSVSEIFLSVHSAMVWSSLDMLLHSPLVGTLFSAGLEVSRLTIAAQDLNVILSETSTIQVNTPTLLGGQVFHWLLFMDRLNTTDMMVRRHWHVEGGKDCVMCSNGQLESRDHLFFSCPFAKRCWEAVHISWDMSIPFSQRIMTPSEAFAGTVFFFEGQTVGENPTAIFINYKYVQQLFTDRMPCWHCFIEILSCVAWNIWKERNKFIF